MNARSSNVADREAWLKEVALLFAVHRAETLCPAVPEGPEERDLKKRKIYMEGRGAGTCPIPRIHRAALRPCPSVAQAFSLGALAAAENPHSLSARALWPRKIYMEGRGAGTCPIPRTHRAALRPCPSVAQAFSLCALAAAENPHRLSARALWPRQRTHTA
jgi:hypothetical protein